MSPEDGVCRGEVCNHTAEFHRRPGIVVLIRHLSTQIVHQAYLRYCTRNNNQFRHIFLYYFLINPHEIGGNAQIKYSSDEFT